MKNVPHKSEKISSLGKLSRILDIKIRLYIKDSNEREQSKSPKKYSEEDEIKFIQKGGDSIKFIDRNPGPQKINLSKLSEENQVNPSFGREYSKKSEWRKKIFKEGHQRINSSKKNYNNKLGPANFVTNSENRVVLFP